MSLLCNIVGPADHGNPMPADFQMAALLVTGAVLVIAAGGVVAWHCSSTGLDYKGQKLDYKGQKALRHYAC